MKMLEKTSKSQTVGKERKYRLFLITCLSLYDYQTKASRYRKRLTYLKNRATTCENQTLHSQKKKKKRERER